MQFSVVYQSSVGAALALIDFIHFGKMDKL